MQYPISDQVGDHAFTFGLVQEVCEVLEAHGYPQIVGIDHANLSVALYRFIYQGDKS